ncbi:MAG: T9SS type A sorting domain-containing protein [Chitinophagales bacterium]
MRSFILLLLLLSGGLASAQFAPAAGLPGSTAVWKEDARILAWATSCTLVRGYQNIADTSLGYASVGNEEAAIGGVGNGVVSLGDGGSATLTFAQPVYNGDGFDFAVFENGFPTDDSLAFLEFAFVEVSSDGVNFFRFPATSLMQDTAQLPMVGINCALYNNLAGKYTNGYGTPFDLEELKNEAGLDVNSITHIRLVDVVGSIDPAFATHDAAAHIINDPFPTPYPSSGFDLDAVGVMHAVGISGVNNNAVELAKAYPNPSANGVWMVDCSGLTNARATISDVSGKVVFSSVVNAAAFQIDMQEAQSGIYFLQLTSGTITKSAKLIKL